MRLRLYAGVVGIGLLVLLGVFAASAQDSVSYVVQSGDILDSIAASFDVQTACLAEGNNLGAGNEIKPGQELVIDFSCPRYDGLDFVTNPREEGQAPPAEEDGQGGGGVEPGPNDQTYTVERGDTLDTIGQALNISSVAIQFANGLRPGDFLEIGQVLVIPADAPAYGQFPALSNPADPNAADTELGQGGGGITAGAGDQTYVVQPLDVLDLIGAQFDTQALCIAEANALGNPSRIFPGQTLVIPGNCPPYDGEAPVENPRGS
ncbi:MAG: LysM peptidoglycan-binding domain-containing protein [Anaerolineae bacterium]|nr:LysM peptidoglycan-binding domain-containing protein [Anaerolineae bacterium]